MKRMEDMTAAEVCKKAGLKSLRNTSKLSGVAESTLYQWHKSEKKNKLFNIIIYGLLTKEYKKTLQGFPNSI